MAKTSPVGRRPIGARFVARRMLTGPVVVMGGADGERRGVDYVGARIDACPGRGHLDDLGQQNLVMRWATRRSL